MAIFGVSHMISQSFKQALAGAFFAGALLVGTAAQAQQMFDAATGQDVTAILQELGYSAQLGVDNEGDPMITGAIEGKGYMLYFYRCEENSTPRRCLDLQFSASFPLPNVTLEMVNTYNQNNRFGQAYINADGTVGVDMSVTLQGGVTRQNIKENIDWWKTALTSFEEKLMNPGQ